MGYQNNEVGWVTSFVSELFLFERGTTNTGQDSNLNESTGLVSCSMDVKALYFYRSYDRYFLDIEQNVKRFLTANQRRRKMVWREMRVKRGVSVQLE